MEKKHLADLIQDFDQFVQLSLLKKDQSQIFQQSSNQTQNYLSTMEKRLKLIPLSQQQKFQNIIKPMKELKSFVSVREFMQKLGSGALMPKQNKSKISIHQQKIKLEYQTLRGGYYLQSVEQHLKRKQFKRLTSKAAYLASETEDNPLEHSQYKSWVQSTLSKISVKSEPFFKKLAEQDLKNHQQQESAKREDNDCLIAEHKQIYAEQFKIVPKIREVGDQQYQQFAKISNLLTSRLKKILKFNSPTTKTVRSQPSSALNKKLSKNQSRSTLRVINQNLPIGLESKRDKPNRVQTAINMKRQKPNSWFQSMNYKMKIILNNQQKSKVHMDVEISNLE